MKDPSLRLKANCALVCFLAFALSVGAQGTVKRPKSHRPETTDPAFSDAFLGFHTCDALGVDDMQKWWDESPFYAAGIYIGGVSRTCDNEDLDPTWVSTVEAQGWGLLPLWPGEQAPCACRKYNQKTKKCESLFPHRFTLENAATKGMLEAAEAITTANYLGLGGSIVYYDMEYYNPHGDGGTCGTAVAEFLGAWTKELQTNNFAAGVYGNPIDAQANFVASSPLPDDVWLTEFSPTNVHYILPKETIWGWKPLCDLFSKPSCDYWSDGQRVGQYAGNVPQKWGGVAVPMTDLDIVDGQFADSA
jgi:Domain of unknown function (DUF1906)